MGGGSRNDSQERLLEVIVGLCGDVVVLKVLLPVEGDGLCLDLALLDIDLVAGQDDGDVLADTNQVTWIGQGKYIFTQHIRIELEDAYGASWGRSCR